MKTENQFIIPMALLVVIEDVGWWKGQDDSFRQRPYRTGMNRQHFPEDYEAIAFLGKHLRTQILAGFVLCEWDRLNLLRSIPGATWQGTSWDNPFKKNPLLDRAATIINDNQEFIEIALHGVGHEFWEGGVLSRSEFHDSDGNMRDQENILRHFKAFYELFKYSGIKSPAPKIFIPPAMNHSFGNGEKSFQKIISEFGINFVLTVFKKSKQHAQPLYDNFTRECGVTLIERGNSPVHWDDIASEPVYSFKWPILPLHWGNILHNNPLENLSITEKWADFIKRGAKDEGMIILPGVSETLTQIIYSQLAEIQPVKNGVRIDLKRVRGVLPCDQDDGFYIKMPLGMNRACSFHGVKIVEEKHGVGETCFKIKPQKTESVRILFK